MRDPVAARADASPGAPALIDAGDGERWTYAALDVAVEETAGRLAALGLSPGDHLGTLLPTRIAHVRVVHAALRLGLRLVPLNVRLAEPELGRQADRADLDALVAGADTAATARSIADAVVSVDPGDRALSDRDPEPIEPAEWALSEPALLSFTSGTTGEPKAVTLTAGNLLASACASAFRLGVLPDDRWLVPLPMYHMGGLAPVLRSALYGTAVVVQEGFDPAAAIVAADEYGVTGVSLVPTMLRRVLDAGDLSDLRFVLLGGAPAPRELIERCERRDVPVHPTYGLTETASQVATATPAEAFAHPDTVGHPLAFTEVTVLDDGPVERGEVGEIVVSGPTVTPGYYGDPEATAAAFCEHGLRTGDAGYRDEAGRLRVVGRLDDRIVTGGENVHPAEVVDALRSHPAVGDAAVVGLDDPEWGQRVAALVVPGDDLDADDLLEYCRGRLAGYKCPKTIRFADELPRTASGTVDREAVRERLRG